MDKIKLLMKKTNFDHYLEKQLQDPAFAVRFERAGEAWDVVLQVAVSYASRECPGLVRGIGYGCHRKITETQRQGEKQKINVLQVLMVSPIG